MSDHVRNTGPMLASPRCGAKTRCGGACRSPAARGKDFVKKKEWDEDEIVDRSKALFGFARNLWVAP
jgi:hypothetical protein